MILPLIYIAIIIGPQKSAHQDADKKSWIDEHKEGLLVSSITIVAVVAISHRLKQIGGGLAAGLGVLGAGIAAYKHHEHKEETVGSFFLESIGYRVLSFDRRSKVLKHGLTPPGLAEARRLEGQRPGFITKGRIFQMVLFQQDRNMTGPCMFVAHSET